MALLLTGAASTAVAQTDTVPPRVESGGGLFDGVVRYGRWVTAAGAFTLSLLALQEHGEAESHWDRLTHICRVNSSACVVGPEGRYADPAAELEYRATIHHDKVARGRLIWGQIALGVTVGLFLIEVGGDDGGPENIPLAPLEVGVTGDGARVGVRLAF